MGINWGGFASGFSQGFNNGTQIGNTVKNAMKERQIDEARAQGLAEAQQMRANALAGAVQDNGLQGQDQARANDAQPAAPVNTYKVEAPTSTADVAPGQVQQTNAPPLAPELAGAPVQSDQQAPIQATAAPTPAQPGSAAMAATSGIVPKRFSVNGRGFDTEAEARAHAESVTPSVNDFMIKTLVPKMQEAYMAQGDVDKAEAWGKYAKDKAAEKNMDTWGKMYRAANSGDMESAADHAFELYKSYDDGITPVSKETVKDKDGNVTGFNMKLKDDSTGEVRSQFIDQRQIVEMGLAALSPPAMFEQTYKRQQAADAMRAKAAIDNANDQRTAARQDQRDINKEARAEGRDVRAAARDDAKMKTQHGYKLEEMTTEAQLKDAGISSAEESKIQSKIDIMKENGYSAEDIKAAVPHLIGAEGYKKTTDPTERRALIAADLLKNDPSFAREKDHAKQNMKVDQMMDIVYGPQKKTPVAPPVAPTAAPAPTPTVQPTGMGPGGGRRAYLTPSGVVYR